MRGPQRICCSNLAIRLILLHTPGGSLMADNCLHEAAGLNSCPCHRHPCHQIHHRRRPCTQTSTSQHHRQHMHYICTLCWAALEGFLSAADRRQYTEESIEEVFSAIFYSMLTQNSMHTLMNCPSRSMMPLTNLRHRLHRSRCQHQDCHSRLPCHHCR